MTQDKNICPVCGFDGLREPPYSNRKEPSHEVCPCCGFEFGFDDSERKESFESYRSSWIKGGVQWFKSESKPDNWDLKIQLQNIGYHNP